MDIYQRIIERIDIPGFIMDVKKYQGQYYILSIKNERLYCYF